MTPQMRITPHGIEYRDWRRVGDTRNLIATQATPSDQTMSCSRGPGDIVELSAQARGAAAYRRAAGGGGPTPRTAATQAAPEPVSGFTAGVIAGVIFGAALTLAALLIGGLI